MLDLTTAFAEFPVLVTDRLILRNPQTTDAEAVYRIMADPQVLRYFGSPPMTRFEQALNRIAGFHAAFTAHEGIRCVSSVCSRKLLRARRTALYRYGGFFAARVNLAASRMIRPARLSSTIEGSKRVPSRVAGFTPHTPRRSDVASWCGSKGASRGSCTAAGR
jgi:hypothetical protein